LARFTALLVSLSGYPNLLDGEIFAVLQPASSLALNHAIKERLDKWWLSNLVVASCRMQLPPVHHFYHTVPEI